MFVVADAFTASARAKIEAAGGVVNVLEVPTVPRKAIGLEKATETPKDTPETTESTSESTPVDADAPDSASVPNAADEAATTSGDDA